MSTEGFQITYTVEEFGGEESMSNEKPVPYSDLRFVMQGPTDSTANLVIVPFDHDLYVCKFLTSFKAQEFVCTLSGILFHAHHCLTKEQSTQYGAYKRSRSDSTDSSDSGIANKRTRCEEVAPPVRTPTGYQCSTPVALDKDTLTCLSPSALESDLSGEAQSTSESATVSLHL